MLDEEEENQVVEKTMQDSALIHTDITNPELIDQIIKYANDAYEGSENDKEICTKLKKLLDNDPKMNIPSNPHGIPNQEELGAWQCIIGRQFCASVTFDAECLIYFMFTKINKYFMVFRS